MDAEQRVQDLESTTPRPAPHPEAVIRPGASVVIMRPRRLRGTIAVVQRRATGGWEVEIRTSAGTPQHLVVPEGALHLR